MNQPLDHEHPLLLVLRDGDRPSDAFLALLDHPEVRLHQWPAPWSFERAGIDLPAALPDLRTITRERLPQVLDVLLRLHTPQALDALVRQIWRGADERVRAFFLKRPVLSTFASTVGMAPKSVEIAPPEEFVAGQVIVHRFELEYRLQSAGEVADPLAPPEEGSLVLYPFDPANQAARREANLPEGTAPILEAFAYGAGRAGHRRVLEDIAHARGWQVIDTAEA
jgi:hypothetical protein